MCQLFISKDFETSLLTLLGVSLVLWRRKAERAQQPPVLWPSPLTSQHLHFQFPITSLLKIFVRSRCDWKEKYREGSRHSFFVEYFFHSALLFLFSLSHILYTNFFWNFYFLNPTHSLSVLPFSDLVMYRNAGEGIGNFVDVKWSIVHPPDHSFSEWNEKGVCINVQQCTLCNVHVHCCWTLEITQETMLPLCRFFLQNIGNLERL